jgi:putative membrane protein
MISRTLRDAWAIACMDGALLRRFKAFHLAVAAVVVIPAAYALIYLSSVWDPAARTEALPAAIVNLDAGVDYRGQSANVGAELSDSIRARHLFGFQLQDDEAAARKAVREGRLVLALIIPPDFSANAVPGRERGAGRLTVYISEGNNYAAAGMARRFAAELGHQVNEALNEKRWALVLSSTAGSQQSVRKLKEGMDQLRQGSHELERGLQQAGGGARELQDGARQLNAASSQLAGGARQAAQGARQLDARRPPAAELQALKGGAHALADGHAELGRGLEKIQAGTEQLTQGAGRLHDEAEDIPFVGEKLARGAGALADGSTQLGGALQQARQGQKQLADGAARLNTGVARLADGMSALGDGVHTLATRLPDDTKLDEFGAGMDRLAQGTRGLNTGVEKLHAGAARLTAGLDLLVESLPSVPSLDGSARGLADSVQPVVEVVAPVPNNGSGFAPNFVPVALWLGAVMTAFLFHLRRLPESARGASRLSQILGKLALLTAIVLAQSGCVLLMLTLLLEMPVPHLGAFWLTLSLASVTFLLIIVALTRALGDIGKGVALLLLVLQLSSAGGILPIELSGQVFQGLNPWLPFTWVVRAFRASLFGAYDNAWLKAWSVIALIAFLAFLAAAFIGRWQYVRDEEHRPALDV